MVRPTTSRSLTILSSALGSSMKTMRQTNSSGMRMTEQTELHEQPHRHHDRRQHHTDKEILELYRGSILPLIRPTKAFEAWFARSSPLQSSQHCCEPVLFFTKEPSGHPAHRVGHTPLSPTLFCVHFCNTAKDHPPALRTSALLKSSPTPLPVFKREVPKMSHSQRKRSQHHGQHQQSHQDINNLTAEDTRKMVLSSKVSALRRRCQ